MTVSYGDKMEASNPPLGKVKGSLLGFDIFHMYHSYEGFKCGN